MLFGNPDHRDLLVDWHNLAPIALGMFRAENAGHAGDPEYDRLVGTLMACSSEFRYFWQKHEVSGYTPINKRIRHPTAGRMIFDTTALLPTISPARSSWSIPPSERSIRRRR